MLRVVDMGFLGLSFGHIYPRGRSQNPQRSAATPPVLFSLLRINLTQNSALTVCGLVF